MDGVSTDDFTSWTVDPARRKLDTLLADTDSTSDKILSTHYIGREHIESSLELEIGLSNGMVISN